MAHCRGPVRPPQAPAPTAPGAVGNMKKHVCCDLAIGDLITARNVLGLVRCKISPKYP
jgi:hypothetical protein